MTGLSPALWDKAYIPTRSAVSSSSRKRSPRGFCLALGLFWMMCDVIYSTVEDHEPGGVTDYDLRQNPGGPRYLPIAAFIGYQSV